MGASTRIDWVPQEEQGGSFELAATEPRERNDLPESSPKLGFYLVHVQTACLMVIAGALLMYGLYFTRTLMVPVTVAIVLNFVLSPVVQRMERMGFHTMLGSAIVMVALVGFAAVGIFQLQRPAAKWLTSAPTAIPRIQAKLRPVEKPVKDIAEASKRVEEITESVESKDVLKVQVQQPSLASLVLSQNHVSAGRAFPGRDTALFPTCRGRSLSGQVRRGCTVVSRQAPYRAKQSGRSSMESRNTSAR